MSKPPDIHTLKWFAIFIFLASEDKNLFHLTEISGTEMVSGANE
jgi:hypothetical protein